MLLLCLSFFFDYKAAANSHASNYLIKYAIFNLIKSFYSVDAVSDVEDFDDEEDLGRKLHQLRFMRVTFKHPNNSFNIVAPSLELARETLERLRSAAQHPTYVPESTVAPGTYRVRRTRATQYPIDYRRQYAPRMTRVTPCGKCLRVSDLMHLSICDIQNYL